MNHGIQIVQNVRKCIKWESIGIWYIHVFQSGHKQSIRYSKSPYGPWRTPKFDGIDNRRFMQQISYR